MPVKYSTKSRKENLEPASIHLPVETVDAAQSDLKAASEVQLRRQIRDLQEQTKLIPLLQLQIQSLRDERQQLLFQSEVKASRASSVASTSPNSQPVFQAQRVSPVSLNAIKFTPPAPPKRANRSTGTNTNVTLQRDVGCSPEKITTSIHRAVSTDFIVKVDGDGGRLYTERDLKKAIEMAHAKMRKITATVGVQAQEKEPEK